MGSAWDYDYECRDRFVTRNGGITIARIHCDDNEKEDRLLGDWYVEERTERSEGDIVLGLVQLYGGAKATILLHLIEREMSRRERDVT